MAFVRDVSVEKHALVVNNAPAVAALRRERHANYLRATLRQLLHLLMAFIRDVSVEECATLRDDAPAITARWERYPTDIIARGGELLHLLVTFVRNVSIEEYYCHLSC